MLQLCGMKWTVLNSTGQCNMYLNMLRSDWYERIWKGFTPEQRLQLWRMWKAGSSTTDIGIALSKPPGTIHGHLALKGGFALYNVSGQHGI